ncbi:hypothetical protein V6Z11_D01G076500 [Gossypium hirsutum]
MCSMCLIRIWCTRSEKLIEGIPLTNERSTSSFNSLNSFAPSNPSEVVVLSSARSPIPTSWSFQERNFSATSVVSITTSQSSSIPRIGTFFVEQFTKSPSSPPSYSVLFIVINMEC